MSNKKTDNKFFFGEKRKTEKESLTEVYKDSKNCEERLQIEKTKRQSKSKKNKKMKWRKKAKNTEKQKKEQVDRGRTKRVDEEAERTFKKVKMLNWRRNTPFLSLSQKKAKTEVVENNVVFSNDRKVCKRRK